MRPRSGPRRLSHAHPVAARPARRLPTMRLSRLRLPAVGTQGSLLAALAVVVVSGAVLLGAGRPAPAAAPTEDRVSSVLGIEDRRPEASGSTLGARRVPDPLGEGSSAGESLVPLPGSLTGYVWPLDDARITGAFGPRRKGTVLNAGVPFHDGLDISSFCGDRIVAAHDGVVLAAGRRYHRAVGWLGDLTAYEERMNAGGLWGSVAIGIVIDDGNGYRSVYLHFSRIVVKEGDTVTAGQFLGWEGQTGYASGCHLHYELFSPSEKGTFQLDPKIAERSHLPADRIARIDPLLVLPPVEDGRNTWGWGAIDTP